MNRMAINSVSLSSPPSPAFFNSTPSIPVSSSAISETINNDKNNNKEDDRKTDKPKFFWQLRGRELLKKSIEISLAVGAMLAAYEQAPKVRKYIEGNSFANRLMGSYQKKISKGLAGDGFLKGLNESLSTDTERSGIDKPGELIRSLFGWHPLEENAMMLYGILGVKGLTHLLFKNNSSTQGASEEASKKTGKQKESLFARITENVIILAERVMIASIFMSIFSKRSNSLASKITGIGLGVVLGELFEEFQKWTMKKCENLINKLFGKKNDTEKYTLLDSLREMSKIMIGAGLPADLLGTIKHSFAIHSMNSLGNSPSALKRLKDYNHATVLKHKERHLAKLKLWPYSYEFDKIPKFKPEYHTLKNWKIYSDWLKGQSAEQAGKAKSLTRKLLNWYEFDYQSFKFKFMRYPNWTDLILKEKAPLNNELKRAMAKDLSLNFGFAVVDTLLVLVPLYTIYNFVVKKFTEGFKNSFKKDKKTTKESGS